jgi:hypothetical protein
VRTFARGISSHRILPKKCPRGFRMDVKASDE